MKKLALFLVTMPGSHKTSPVVFERVESLDVLKVKVINEANFSAIIDS